VNNEQEISNPALYNFCLNIVSTKYFSLLGLDVQMIQKRYGFTIGSTDEHGFQRLFLDFWMLFGRPAQGRNRAENRNRRLSWKKGKRERLLFRASSGLTNRIY
jgi:hypothetical protein